MTSIRRPDAPVTPPRSTEIQAPAARAPEQNAVAKPKAASEFSGTAAQRGLDVPQQHVPLKSANVGAAGPVELDTPVAQAAIDKSLDFLNSQGISRNSAADTVKAKGVEVDELGMTHVRLDRVHEGVPVFGEQLISHLNDAGEVVHVTGGVSEVPVGLGAGEVALTKEQALSVALEKFGLEPTDVKLERVVFKADDGSYKAAYRAELTNLFDGEHPQRMNYMVDANSGEVLADWNQMGGIHLPDDHGHSGKLDSRGNPVKATGNGSGGAPVEGGEGGEAPALGDDTSLYSGMIELQTKQNEDGTFSLFDENRGNGVETVDGNNQSRPKTGTPFVDANNAWAEASDSPRDAAAVDAHYGASMTYDFYKDVLGRDSIDGKGEKLTSIVHVGTNYVNAFWDGTQMYYGDGDGKNAAELTTLDIAGHEITHGLVQRTAGLVYRNESGALNEAMADIMGTGVEWYAAQQNQNVVFDYAIGEDAWTPGNGDDTDALRYMFDPTRDGSSKDHYSKRYEGWQDNGGVHWNSGIANNAFYLLAEGGENPTSGEGPDQGIGIEKGLKIYGRALTHYMTPNTTFHEARQATIQAATDLYGADSVEVATVKESWAAVGVDDATNPANNA